MSNKKYVLTISILASNRKDTLPKTLASIKPLLDNVSSELIIVDTGCDEELLEIIRQYTDKIVKFEWCKDFAKARNAGLFKAQGEWFMFIDDDEWFEDVTEIIDFFNSDEKDKYGYAKYMIRNYNEMEGITWMDSIAGRMFRILEGTRYVDAVHERPVNIAGPTKTFDAYAHHYGYVFKNEVERRAHIKRNTELLVEQLKREPGRVRHYCHMTQEFNTIKEYAKSMEYALEGIEKGDMSNKENQKDVVGLYGTVVWIMVNETRYEDAIRQSEEYMKSPYMNKLGELALAGFCAISAYLLKRYDESVGYADKFFAAYDYFQANHDERYLLDAILVTQALERENIIRIAGVGLTAAATVGNEEKVFEYGDRLDFKEARTIYDEYFCMRSICDMMVETTNPDRYVDLLKKIMVHNKFFTYILGRVVEIKKEDISAFLKLADIIGQLDSDNGYIQFMKIVRNRNTPDTEMLTGLCRKAARDITDIINIDHEFWSIVASRNIDISNIIEEKPLLNWAKNVDTWMASVKIKDLIEKKQDLMNCIDNEGMHMRYFDMLMSEAFLIRKRLDDITMDAVREEMMKFVRTVLGFYGNVYKEEIFDHHKTFLPERCQAALIMRELCQNNTEDKVNKANQVSKLMPALGKIMDKYKELV